MSALRRSITWPEIFAVTIVGTLLFALIRPAMPDGLFDPFGQAREKARTTLCASNLKIIGLANLQYVQDYDEREPGGSGHWAGELYPYIKETGTYDCPDDKAAKPTNESLSVCSYAFNANAVGVNEARINDPAVTVLSTEYDGGPAIDLTSAESKSRSTTGHYPNTAWGNVRLGSGKPLVTASRHTKGSIFGACDGHVRILSAADVSSGTDSRTSHAKQTADRAAGTANLPNQHFVMTFSVR